MKIEVRSAVRTTVDGKIGAFAASAAPLVGLLCWWNSGAWWAPVGVAVAGSVAIAGVLLFLGQRTYTHDVTVRQDRDN